MGNGALPKNGHVIIVGGGPAGSACALALRRLSDQLDRVVRVTLLEGKQFAGEQHYNQCVGVLSPPLPELLEQELGIQFPNHLARGKITGYTLHSASEELAMEDEGEPSIALRRVQYDAFMLEAVKERGIVVQSARAVDLEFHAGNVVVYTDNKPLVGDVVVGAFGLDEGSSSVFSRVTPYRPPESLFSVVTKYHPGDEAMLRFGSHIHAFLPRHPRIEFGGVTPKGNHLTINIAGKTVDAPLMQSFLDQRDVRHLLPHLEQAGKYDPDDLRYFKGRFPYSEAQNYYGDRYVMVGDAAGLVRSFKGKGVTSAVMTGIRAAHSILEAGISRSAFHAYYRMANQDILRDLPYGRAIRVLIILLSRTNLLGAVIRAARLDPRLRSALYGAVSGNTPYRQIWADSLVPKSLWTILQSLNSKPSQN
jgi:flavin-dependent dehydrogenase